MRGNIIIIVTEKDLGLGTSPVGHRGESLTPYFTNTSHYPQRLSHNASNLSVFHEVSLQKKMHILWKPLGESLEGPMRTSGSGRMQDRALSVCPPEG